MIDFRYHLVSLVSVFLALAVGIVLGAGPLQGQITSTFKDQVQKLSDDKTRLNTELGTARTSVNNRDAFTTAVLPALVARQLSGRAVAVVTLPGSDDGAVKPLVEALQAAGAQVTGRIDVKEAWTAADKAADRVALAQAWKSILAQPASENAPATSASPTPSVAVVSASPSARSTRSATSSLSTPSLSTPSPTTAATAEPTPADQVLEALLARAVLTTQPASGQSLDATAQDLLDALAKMGMITVNGDLTGRASQVVVLAPGVEQATIAGSEHTGTASASPDVTPTWTALASVLDRAGDGAVVVGPASSATSGGVVAALRASGDVAKRVSTVDTGGTPMGDVTTVFALREQLTGAAGGYGFGKAAAAALPSIAAAP